MYIKKYNDREVKKDTKVIFVGPYVGSWGHLFHFHIPIVNRLREENPNAYIVSAGYVGDDYYYKNAEAEYTIDAYMAFETDPDIRRVYGLAQAQYSREIKAADKLCAEHFGHVDINHMTPPQDGGWAQFVHKMKRSHYRLGLFAEDKMQKPDRYVILHSKNSKPLSDRDTKGDAIANADIETDREFVRLLAKHVHIYIAGIPGECNTFSGENITDLTHLSAEERPEVLLDLTERALCVVSTSSASTINYALSVGTPSICHASRRYKINHDTKYNYYGVPCRHHVKFNFDASARVADTLDFIEKLKSVPRYTMDTRRIDDGMGAWL